MRAASYTRGIHPNIQHTFDPLQKIQYPSNSSNHRSPTPSYSVDTDMSRTTVDQRSITSQSGIVAGGAAAVQHYPQSSMTLQQHRRHSASMTAGPLYRSTSYQSASAGDVSMHPSWDATPKKGGSLKRDNSAFDTMWEKFDDAKLLNKKFLRNNKGECVGWFTLLCLLIVGYKFFSDGSFSAILTLSSAFQCFAMFLLNLKAISQQSIAGVSQRSVGLIVLCLLFRLISTLFYNGYLPVDRSGDWVYQGADIMSALLGILLILYANKYCKSAIQCQKDKDTCIIVIPVIVAGVLALLIHPTLNQSLFADTAWTFALYIETFAMLPQLFMMGKLAGEVEALTSHYIASMAASKIFSFLFWFFSYTELAPRRGGMNIAGWAVLLAYFGQTLLFADFLYYYVKSVRIGRNMIIKF